MLAPTFFEQEECIPCKGENVEHLVWKGEDVHHIVWNDDESDPEFSHNDRNADISSGSDEEETYAKEQSLSQPDGCSHHSKAASADQSSGRSHLQLRLQISDKESDRQLVSSEDTPMPMVNYSAPNHGQCNRRMFSTGVVGHEYLLSGPGVVQRPGHPWAQSPGDSILIDAQDAETYQGRCAKTVRSMDSLSTMSPYSSESMPGMSAMSSDELPTMTGESMGMLLQSTPEQREPGGQRLSKYRPCKGKRTRYRKLVSRLAEEIRKDPDTFDFESSDLPPSIAGDSKAKAKLRSVLQDHIDIARDARRRIQYEYHNSRSASAWRLETHA